MTRNNGQHPWINARQRLPDSERMVLLVYRTMAVTIAHEFAMKTARCDGSGFHTGTERVSSADALYWSELRAFPREIQAKMK